MSKTAEQLDMLNFTSPRARTSDPITSHEAAAEAGSLANHDCAAIWRVLRDSAEPLAAEQISDHLGWNNHVRVNRRLSELVDGGFIVASGEMHKNKSGRRAQKYMRARPVEANSGVKQA